MGRLIDEDKLVDHFVDKTPNGWLVPICENTSRWGLEGIISEIKHFKPTVQAIPKADYENRLKADMVDILTVLLLKIQSESNKIPYDEENTVQFKLGQGNAYDMCKYLIQERINTLKAESEET